MRDIWHYVIATCGFLAIGILLVTPMATLVLLAIDYQGLEETCAEPYEIDELECIDVDYLLPSAYLSDCDAIAFLQYENLDTNMAFWLDLNLNFHEGFLPDGNIGGNWLACYGYYLSRDSRREVLIDG